MARAGVDKTEVQRARDSLLARQQYPSVDAVRAELGNTGSKSTIHRYLKELEAESGGQADRGVAISDALQDLVARLSARLMEEADARAAEAEAACEARMAEAQASVAAAEARMGELQSALAAERTAHEASKKALQGATIAGHTAEQQVADLRERLAENDELRRRQQQALAAREVETVKLNQECARLASETAHAKQALYEQLSLRRQQEDKLEQLRMLQQHAADADRQLVSRMAEQALLAERLAAAEAAGLAAQQRNRELELALEKAEARAQVQEGVAAQVRSYLEALNLPPPAREQP